MLLRAPLVIEAATQHTASLIFLHGLGDTGYGWAPVMSQLAKTLTFMKFILPHAYPPVHSRSTISPLPAAKVPTARSR